MPWKIYSTERISILLGSFHSWSKGRFDFNLNYFFTTFITRTENLMRSSFPLKHYTATSFHSRTPNFRVFAISSRDMMSASMRCLFVVVKKLLLHIFSYFYHACSCYNNQWTLFWSFFSMAALEWITIEGWFYLLFLIFYHFSCIVCTFHYI